MMLFGHDDLVQGMRGLDTPARGMQPWLGEAS